jgi:dipeptidyl aminopeptidase/acylaminoacyl peptidase
MPPSLENEDTPLAAPPAAPGSIENEDTLLAIPPASAAAENAQLAGPPAPAPATPSATPVQIPASTLPPALPASRPHPFLSSEDLLAIQLIGEPQVSPDGLLIAYSIQKSDLATNVTRSSIWLVPVITGASGKLQLTRQLTSSELNSTTPRWSPDGRWLAFLSDRSSSRQVYLLPLNGGEARQVSFLAQPVTDFSWRPDGRALLLQSPWKIEDDEQDQPDESVVQVWTHLDETWDGQGYKHGRHEHLWLLSLEDEQPAARLTFEPVDHMQACWSPDSKELAFCSNRRTAPDLSVSASLWVLNLAASRTRRLTPIEGLAMQPAWSSDGKWLAFYYAASQDETVNIVPWIVEATGESAPRPATTVSQSQTSLEAFEDGLHLSIISRPCWYPDSTSLMVTVQTRGQVHINRLYINTNHEEPLTTGNGCYLSPHLSTNGRAIAALRTDWFTPGDIWTMAGNGANRRRLTSVNDTLLRSRQVLRPKKISWRSFDNLEIEGWLYLPPLPPGAKAPLVLNVHGGPTLAWAESYVHDFQVLAGMGYAVLAANPRGSAGYGEEFCRKIINDWGGDDYRDLLAGVDHVIATEPVDGSRLAITGASYGGYMTCWAITQSKRFKAAVARNPVTSLLTCGPLSDQWLWFDLIVGTPEARPDPEALRRARSPLTFANAITTPLLLIHSTDDLRCPPSESKQIYSALRRRQHQVELALYPGVSHLLDHPGYGSPKQRLDRKQRSFEWIKKYV